MFYLCISICICFTPCLVPQNLSAPWLGELQKCYRACFTTSTPGLTSNSYIGVCNALEEIIHVEATAGEILWSRLCKALLDNVANDDDGRRHTLAMLQVLPTNTLSCICL